MRPIIPEYRVYDGAFSAAGLSPFSAVITGNYLLPVTAIPGNRVFAENFGWFRFLVVCFLYKTNPVITVNYLLPVTAIPGNRVFAENLVGLGFL